MGFRDILSNVGNKTAFYEYFNDFMTYAAAEWTVTTTEAGTGSATEAIGAGAGGHLVLTNAAGDDDLDFLQGPESFKLVAGKRFYFGIRAKVSDATDSDFIAGFVITDTTPLAHTDGIVFQKDDGDALLDVHVTQDSTATDEAGVATLEDDTFVTMEFYYDGRVDSDGAISADSKLQVFVDGTRVAGVALTNMPDDEELAITFGIQNGEAVAKVATIDWIRAFVER